MTAGGQVGLRHATDNREIGGSSPPLRTNRNEY